MLEDDLLDADIYVDGDVLAKGNNFTSRLAEAKRQLLMLITEICNILMMLNLIKIFLMY